VRVCVRACLPACLPACERARERDIYPTTGGVTKRGVTTGKGEFNTD
jgi:hypothetical protein